MGISARKSKISSTWKHGRRTKSVGYMWRGRAAGWVYGAGPLALIKLAAEVCIVLTMDGPSRVKSDASACAKNGYMKGLPVRGGWGVLGRAVLGMTPTCAKTRVRIKWASQRGVHA